MRSRCARWWRRSSPRFRQRMRCSRSSSRPGSRSSRSGSSSPTYPDESWRTDTELCDERLGGNLPGLTRPEWEFLYQAGPGAGERRRRDRGVRLDAGDDDPGQVPRPRVLHGRRPELVPQRARGRSSTRGTATGRSTRRGTAISRWGSRCSASSASSSTRTGRRPAAARPESRRPPRSRRPGRCGRSCGARHRTQRASGAAVSSSLSAVGDSQTVPYDQLLREARERLDEGTDFTVSVEEEFALLDPATLDMVNRFEDVQDAARGEPWFPHLAGELIASEVEIKTGRCETFAEVPPALADRRAQLATLCDGLGLALGATGLAPVGELEGPADHRHAALPPERRDPPLRRLEEQHLRLPRARRDQRRRPGDPRARRAPPLPARAARPLGQLAVRRGRQHGPALRAHADLHPLLPALRRARRVRRLGRPSSGTSASSTRRGRSTSTPSSGGASARTSPTRRSRSATATSSPTSARPRRWRPSASRSRPGVARAIDEGEPLPDPPPRLIEENLWRAIRHGLSGEFIDLATGDVLPTRAHLERLAEWVLPVAEEIGAAPWLAIPERNAAERQIARSRTGRRWRRSTPASSCARLACAPTRSPVRTSGRVRVDRASRMCERGLGATRAGSTGQSGPACDRTAWARVP